MCGAIQGTDHKEYSSMLHKALEGVIMMETFPKTTVDVFALVLESGGSKSHHSVLSFSLNSTQNAPVRFLLREKNQNLVDNLWKHRSTVHVEFNYRCNLVLVVWYIILLDCNCNLYCIAGDLPVVISCAGLALADAGIMMYDLITAVSVVCYNCSHHFLCIISPVY